MLSASAPPGVRYERLDTSAPPVAAVRTDVAGFVGIAERGPLDEPVPVQSWRQFESRFGGFATAGLLPYAVRAFFENGGRRCWVVRVASRDTSGGAAEASVTLRLQDAGGGEGAEAWKVRAATPGSWGNALSILLRETHVAQTVSVPAGSTPEATVVASIDRFARYTAVRITQEGAAPAYRVVSDVDANRKCLFWVHPDPAARTAYDTPLAGFLPDAPLRIESVEYALLVYEGGRFVRAYPTLSPVPEHERYAARVLAAPDPVRPADLQGELPAAPEPVVVEELRPLPLLDFVPLHTGDETARALTGGRDGLALLQAGDFTGEPADPQDSTETRAARTRGFRALDTVDEVTTVAVPDLHVRPVPLPPRATPPPCRVDPCIPATVPPAVAAPYVPEPEQPPVLPDDDVVRAQLDLVEHCEGRADRVALLDPPRSAALEASEGPAAVREWRRRFSSSYAVAYWPWISVVDPLRRSPVVPVPPSGHAAGQFARADFTEGVHRAPANFPLAWAQDVTQDAGAEVHGLLNSEGINVVRALPGRGLRLMGARTLYPDGAFRFLNVRRLLMMVRASLYRSTQWAAFEPNDWLTRAKLTLALSGFLLVLWRRGALAGATAAEAFRVRCDEENNPESERANGRLLAEVDLAPVHPLEFVVVRVGRSENEFEVAEAGASAFGGGAGWR
ncbi:MAG TPA: phage tail sheath C-terminal domain-containing protein [Longimicrobiaceae bacterium]|nr:phage tail sheath C-terminal domain-containing protein [Longimicrobiaceae bacterium]